MKIQWVLFLGVAWLGGRSAHALSLEEKITLAQERCAAGRQGESEILYSNNFKFNMSLEEMDTLYPKIYDSNMRLVHHVVYEAEQDHFISRNDKGEFLVFPKNYLKSLILHVENALRLNYVRYVFFPDMGHSHMLIPLDYYQNHVRVPGRQTAIEALNKILKAPGLKTLYHTAEQLRLIDEDRQVLPDRYLQWRFYTRNPIADLEGHIEIATNYNEKSGHNTVHKLEGYKYYAGFNLSANKKGCFPFEDAQGQIQYFDVSAWDLPYDCSGGGCDY